ncbi:peptidylprolyl isomerase, partial [Escherichia coli]
MAKSAAALHILVKEEKLAHEILAKLERGVSFDHLAKRYSKCPSGLHGGDLGEFQQG